MTELHIFPMASNAFHVELSNGAILEMHEGTNGELHILRRYGTMKVLTMDMKSFKEVVRVKNESITIVTHDWKVLNEKRKLK